MQQDGTNGKETRGAERLARLNENMMKENNTKNKAKAINRFEQALNLPVLCNINPRSIYNKSKEFHTLVKEEQLDVVFISESWERDYMPLDQLIKLEDHTVISNVSQRAGVGGRPAIIANKSKFHVQNIGF